MKLLIAQYIATMDGPILRDAAVAIDGERIADVGPSRELRRRYPQAQIHELGNSVLLPGLINAHTHLELSDCKCGEPPTGGFVGWLMTIVARNQTNTPEQMESLVQNAVGIGVAQCLKFGVTTVGDITRQAHLTRPLLTRGPLRVVSFGEVQALAQRRVLLDERLAIALDSSSASDHLRIGLTPHAPYTVEPFAYERCLQLARERRRPLATHLAESAHEAAFLADHSGPFRDLWEMLGRWDEHVPRFAGGPIRFAKAIGLLDYPTLLAHVNYADDEELAVLADGRASVVWCPRTHAYFGHPPHRWQDMLARGINVALGTDSCASSPDLNLVDDLRLVHRQSPAVPAAALWQMVTTNAATVLGLSHDLGSITKGKLADFVAFPASPGDDPLAAILESQSLPLATWIHGAPCGAGFSLRQAAACGRLQPAPQQAHYSPQTRPSDKDNVIPRFGVPSSLRPRRAESVL